MSRGLASSGDSQWARASSVLSPAWLAELRQPRKHHKLSGAWLRPAEVYSQNSAGQKSEMKMSKGLCFLKMLDRTSPSHSEGAGPRARLLATRAHKGPRVLPGGWGHTAVGRPLSSARGRPRVAQTLSRAGSAAADPSGAEAPPTQVALRTGRREQRRGVSSGSPAPASRPLGGARLAGSAVLGPRLGCRSGTAGDGQVAR